jgi:RNA polymerase subunit RPABC4/transcription elongation factor Spt4
MLDQFLPDLETTINDLVASPVFQLGIRAIGLYIAIIWLACALWAFRDMRARTANPVAPYLAAALVILFLPVFFPFALLLYRILRPKETIAEANDRALAEEAMLAEVAARPHCASCSRPVHEEWIICPTCRNRLRRVCPNCERLVELDWKICAWCGKDFERAEPVGAAYMPPTGRSTRQPALPHPSGSEATRALRAPPRETGAAGPSAAPGRPSSLPRPSVSPSSGPAVSPTSQQLAGEH